MSHADTSRNGSMTKARTNHGHLHDRLEQLPANTVSFALDCAKVNILKKQVLMLTVVLCSCTAPVLRNASPQAVIETAKQAMAK